MSQDAPPNFGGMLHPSPTEDRNFLDHYFASVYNKLEADALLFNRELPHAGLVGSENENAIAEVIRQFLPSKYGVEVNALVIDRFGKVSRQADIVIFDAERQASFFRKVYPIEIVYAVIEVKTSMSSTEAKSAMDNLASISDLEFRPALLIGKTGRRTKKSIIIRPRSMPLLIALIVNPLKLSLAGLTYNSSSVVSNYMTKLQRILRFVFCGCVLWIKELFTWRVLTAILSVMLPLPRMKE
jgi:hypothetical protein